MGLAPSLETTAPPLTRGAVDGAGQVQAEAHSLGGGGAPDQCVQTHFLTSGTGQCMATRKRRRQGPQCRSAGVSASPPRVSSDFQGHPDWQRATP